MIVMHTFKKQRMQTETAAGCVCANVRSKGQEWKNAPLTNNENTHTHTRKTHTKALMFKFIQTLKTDDARFIEAQTDCQRIKQIKTGLFRGGGGLFRTAPRSPCLCLSISINPETADRPKGSTEPRITKHKHVGVKSEGVFT